ncbi:MAG: nodulation protein NfeD, partial [Treponema sp.]|nr:nodulation protein NfeD [Treponema sp.]
MVMIFKKRFLCILFFLCISFLLFPVLSTAQSKEGSAWIIPIQGDIEPSMTAFVRREVRKALSQNAEFLIFEIDTFGGRVDSALQITSFIS